MPETIRYFISYAWTKQTATAVSTGFGNTVMQTPNPIDSDARIAEITASIAERSDAASVIVLNVQRMPL